MNAEEWIFALQPVKTVWFPQINIAPGIVYYAIGDFKVIRAFWRIFYK